MTCKFCQHHACQPGSQRQCWEAMVSESLPVDTVLSMLRANRQEQDAAGKRNRRAK